MELLTGKVRVAIAERYYRPSEVDLLIGNPAKAVKLLGWNPQSTTFAVRICAPVPVATNSAASLHVVLCVQELVREMVEADIGALARGAAPVAA